MGCFLFQLSAIECSLPIKCSIHFSIAAACYTHVRTYLMQVPGRLASWFKSKHKVFKVDKEHITLKPNFLRKHNSSAEFGPPGFPAQDKAAPHPNPWHQGAKRSSEDQRILYLEEKILNWLAMKDKVTTTEMAEFAYATHEDLVPGTHNGCVILS